MDVSKGVSDAHGAAPVSKDFIRQIWRSRARANGKTEP